MENAFAIVIVLIVGLLAGGFAGWAFARGRSGELIASLKTELGVKNAEIAARGDAIDAVRGEFKLMARDVAEDGRKALLDATDERLGEARRDMAHNREVMGELVKPLSEGIDRFDKTFIAGKTMLEEQVKALAEQSARTGEEAGKLAMAFSSSEGRGRWGEMQLRRVVELAGMTERCDFDVQVPVKSAAGGSDRIDMVIRMPSDRVVVVDAKAPLKAYLEALDAETEEDRAAAMRGVAEQVKSRATELSRKAYQDGFKNALEASPDFTVMFLPGEFILPVALREDPMLLETMLESNIVLATPNMLIALLRTIHMGWSEIKLSREAREIAAIGGELYDGLSVFAGHMDKVRKGLSDAEAAYNRGVGSLERNALAKARRLRDYGVDSSKEIMELDTLDGGLRKLRGYEERQAALGEPADSAAD